MMNRVTKCFGISVIRTLEVADVKVVTSRGTGPDEASVLQPSHLQCCIM